MRWLSSFLVVVVMVGSTTLWAVDGVLPGSGTEGDPYLIEDLLDLDVFADEINAATYWASGVYTKLACDPNLIGRIYTTAVIAPDTNNTDWQYNGTPFTSVFDGADYKIFNLTIAGGDYLGLFGQIDAGGEVRNLGMENSNITGGNCLGGLCGSNSGSIINSYSNGDVAGFESVGGLCGDNYHIITSSHTNGNVSGVNSIGGMCGFNSGGITNCYSSCSVSGTSGHHGGLCGINYEGGSIMDCYATGSVSGNSHIGGLCGENNSSSIMSCYATGNVTGSRSSGVGGLCGGNLEGGSITNCYAIGQVVADAPAVGALCGYTYASTITNCYATGSVLGTDSIGGLSGVIMGGTITNCYATGSVLGTDRIGGLSGLNSVCTITNCYATGSVLGTDEVGGLVGYENGSTYTKCFWDSDVNPDVNGIGNTDDPNVIGESTMNMKTQTTFTDVGWDFVGERINGPEDVWMMTCETMNYPKLFYWLPLPGDYFCPDGVDGIDLGHLSDWWLSLCDETNDYCEWAELSNDDTVNFIDFAIFANNWLADAEFGELCTCSEDIDCGTDGFVGNNYCYNDNVNRDYITFECLNPGTPEAVCTNTTQNIIIETCSIGCAGGECVEEGDIVYIDGGYIEGPIILSQPNTYYRLSGDLSTSGTCIIIEADGITLDLNGYTMTGDGDYSEEDIGVYSYENNYITVKDGTITDFYHGVYFDGGSNNIDKNIG